MQKKYKWVLNHSFLSGDVAPKFTEIALRKQSDFSWDKEFRALSQVQPKEITIGDIEINVGDTWMGDLTDRIYSEFCNYRFNIRTSFEYIIKGNIGIWNVKVYDNHEEKENTFIETFTLGSQEITSSKYYAVHKDPKKGLFTMLLYGKQPTGKYAPDFTKPRFTIESDALTQKLCLRQKLLAEEFNHFCKEHYGYELQDLYNKKVQGIRNQTWDGMGRHLAYLLSHLGMSQKWQDRIKARPYQLDGAWRLIADEHNTLLGHEVGLGKTAISCLALMYRIKMGTTKKAMIVVQKSTLLQFAETFQEMFPLSRLLIMDTEKINKHNRQRFLAEASLNCYDAIIITHEAFEFIDLSPDAIESYFENLIVEIEQQVKQSCKYKDGKPSATGQTKFYKDCLAIYESYQKIVTNAKKKIYESGTIFFDELGIDLLIYDEAQKVKNGLILSFSDLFTEHSPSNFANSASNIASDFFFKTEIMRKQLGKQCLWLLTGTPEPTNSPKGVYFMLRVLIPDLLESFGVLSFDAFVSHYIMFSSEPEFKPDGTIHETQRMTGVKNYKSLARLLCACYDIKRYDDVKHYFPNGFRPEEDFIRLECPLSEFQLQYMDELRERYEQWANPKKENKKYPIRDKEGYLMWQPMTFVDIGIEGKYSKPPAKYREYLLNPYTGEKMKSVYDEFYKEACQQVLDLIYERTKNDDEGAGLLPPDEQYKYFYINDSFFQIYGDATKLMLDERLVNSDEWHLYGQEEIGLIDPNGKIMTTARYVADWYHKSAHKCTTCAIFLDLGAPNSAMKLSLYQELKSALVSLKVLPEEIAFIQDYDTDDKKMRLFDRFNNGEVRIIFGHTRSLGIGVNIQRMLELMILFDIPKTPDMYEQRIGRILRSGNTNQKVTIVQLLAKGKPGRSYGADPHAFELLLRKIKMREAVFSFNATVNHIETDIKETETLFELLKAHATGDIRILEYKEKKARLDTFIAKKSSYERDLASAENPKANGSIQWLEKQQDYAIKAYDQRCQDLELMKQIDFDNFSITLNGEVFCFLKNQSKEQLKLTSQSYSQTETELCDYFQKFLQIVIGKAWTTYTHKLREKVGSFNGVFDIYVSVYVKSFYNDKYQYDSEWSLISPVTEKGYVFSVSPTNTIKAIVKAIKAIANLVDASKQKINEWGKDIENKKKKTVDYKLWIVQLTSQIDALKPEVDRLGYELGMGDKPPELIEYKKFNPYEILRVSSDSTFEDIKTQYRHLAKLYHPDTNQGDASCEEKMKLLTQAYEQVQIDRYL